MQGLGVSGGCKEMVCEAEVRDSSCPVPVACCVSGTAEISGTHNEHTRESSVTSGTASLM